MHSPNRISYFARPTARGGGPPFGIKRADRFFHLYAIGKTGTGKSTFLETLMRQDFHHGQGFAFVDPHGDWVGRLAAQVPEGTIYLDLPNATQPYGFNSLRRVIADRRALVAGGVLEVFRTMWLDWGVRMEHILRNALLALLELPEANLADILRLLRDKAFRRGVALKISHPPVQTYWLREFRAVPEFMAPVENNVGAFLTDRVRDRTRTMAAKISCSDPLCAKQRSEKALAFVEQLAGLLAEHKRAISAKQL